jgi:hypothetical protein
MRFHNQNAARLQRARPREQQCRGDLEQLSFSNPCLILISPAVPEQDASTSGIVDKLPPLSAGTRSDRRG